MQNHSISSASPSSLPTPAQLEMGFSPNRGRILIVDDEQAIRRLLSDRLGLEGFDCSDTSGGSEALELLETQPFDTVISDLRMPGTSGLELLEAVREKHPQVAFLMATAVNDVRVGIQAMKAGADDYLVKPFQLDEVLTALDRAIQRKRLEREVEDYRQRLEEMVDQRTRQLQVALKRVERAYDETLEALSAVLDLRDNETAGHSRRVTGYCLEIAQAMGCSSEQLKTIARGVYLHDIGKFGIPDAILRKPGKLTEEEMAIMETHVRIGYELVCRIAFLAGSAQLVLTHHERYDGTGYPQGLLGEEIPLSARIFAVADTLDAMTSDRPYRRALPYSAAREEIIRESERQFDPKVVKEFLAIPEEVLETIRLEATNYHTHVRSPESGVIGSSSITENETGAIHPSSSLPARPTPPESGPKLDPGN
jgi:response regulator RpfG family c-di-GMP phosphodiesterase